MQQMAAIPDDSPVESTGPGRSRGPQDAGFVSSTTEWVSRCALRIASLWADVSYVQAQPVAFELALDDALRAREPEAVADELVGVERARPD